MNEPLSQQDYDLLEDWQLREVLERSDDIGLPDADGPTDDPGAALLRRGACDVGNDTAGGPKVAQIPTATAAMASCARCHVRWGGLKTAHCAACHQTFTAVTAFDKHRSGSHSEDTRRCLDPASVGLIDAQRAYPCWGLPGRADERFAT
jgi:hypothetical protein